MTKIQIYQDIMESMEPIAYANAEFSEIKDKIVEHINCKIRNQISQDINEAHRAQCNDFFGMDCVSLATKPTDTKTTSFSYNFALDYGIT